ncbi:hypothetical protein [Aureispira sp. CCB-E]|uniref:hypothetical protein n=1 Tax=Aureispira sp. CCB-E TaxID=3051121 RepID=UPI0028695AB7|nr:hypothetical protein [Aureispira sp. CCB-E]WMX12416.1 hypothetical protein QP953_16425 [Aureispira sp. CCB-E]
MTTFGKNPHVEARKKLNFKIFHGRLNTTLEKKFKHQRFAERFAMANAAFDGMSVIAQLASLTTAFMMLSYLFVGVHIIARVACSAVLVLAIEAIKREATNDVMKGIFQYKEVEKFPALLALITVSASIYISVEGAKILPDFFISDAVEMQASIQSSDAIHSDFAARIADKEAERNQYRENRTWKGRLASKDALVIQEYNEDIKALQMEKDEALKALNEANQSAQIAATTAYQNELERVQVQRQELGKQLVITAVVFEVLFLLSLCFSWWYHAECKKEKDESETAEVSMQVIEKQEKGTPEVSSVTAEVHPETAEVSGSPRQHKKASFIDYEEVNETQEVTEKTIEVEKVKKEFTRICPTCSTPFVHRSANHKYCTRVCMIEARKERMKEDK